MRQHLLVLVCEAKGVLRLLGRALDFAPKSVLDGLLHLVGAWTRFIHLRDHPSLLRCGYFAKGHAKNSRFRQLMIGVRILGRRVLHGKPLIMINFMDAVVLAKIQIKENQQDEKSGSYAYYR